MRAVAPPPPVPWLFLPGHDEVQLIHLRRAPAPRVAWAGLARFPAGWHEVPASRVQSAMQTFVTYQRAGDRRTDYHCVALIDTAPTAQVIARVNLAAWRVSVLLTGNGYEARWNAGDVSHRISGGPVELGGFMELVLGLRLG